MKKSFLVLLACIAFFAGACQKQGGLTPPIATPNQNLPLYEMAPESMEGPDGSTGTVGNPIDSPDYITATPNTIRTYKSGANYDSHIVIVDGVFKPNSTVHIWGEAINSWDITSPPWIYEKDTDEKMARIQLLVNEAGGIDFWVRAGDDPGVFTIKIAGIDPDEGTGKEMGGWIHMTGATYDTMPSFKVLSTTIAIIK